MNHVKKLLLLVSCITIVHLSYSQNSPYKVYDTKSVILQQPYLTDPSETGITVSWLTDTYSQSKVMYGKKGEGLTQTAETQTNGLRPVDTKHSIRINNLQPGTTYEYKVLSRRVVRLNAYWPDMGNWVESPVYTFTTFDKKKSDILFSYITDTHENVPGIQALLKLVDWNKTDFLAQTGDALNWAESENQLFKNWLSPIANGLQQRVPFVYARGNHDLRGPFARNWYEYMPNHSGKFYYATDHGPAHFLILDSGEDKPDTTSVYAGLNNLVEYRKEEYAWLKNHIETDRSVKEAPFRIILMHDPRWGWMEKGEQAKWTELANAANVNLVLAGHYHRFRRINPGEADGNKYPILVLGQKQIAHVKVNNDVIHVEIKDQDDKLVDSFEVNRKGELKELGK
jgi:predicted phosphodiesterase